MVISEDKKLIFIHIPKTAGSSIAKSMARDCGKVQFGGMNKVYDTHTTARQLKASYPKYDNFFTFAFVRNPWDRLYSWFAFLCNGRTVGPELRRKVRALGFKCWLMEDEHILKRTFLPNERIIGGQRRPQTDWVFDGTEQLVTFVGKFETIENDWGVIQKATGFGPLPEEKFRKSERGDYREAYDSEMREFVAHYFDSDILHFGYKFDE